jgi:hypothetical protein
MRGQESVANEYLARPHFITATEHPWQGSFTLDFERNISVPGSITRYLREYQREGIKFLYRLWKEGRGGVLGDDMGLGTLFTIPLNTFSISNFYFQTRENNSSYLLPLSNNEEDWRQSR